MVVPEPVSVFVFASAPLPMHENPVTYAREDCKEASSSDTPGVTNPHYSPVPSHIELESLFQLCLIAPASSPKCAHLPRFPLSGIANGT
ncbi:hypothetical protein DSO57_1035140 [Entomophthora muscae]|uniref:Uncharacterized protein n=1 Tax=Entomophthora muscae TaxID=34485 RepID=A0ACC2RQI0_9FUNG|nr:hypothetical protein DSO57_1035140 [Entomophthora muscae]